MIYNAMFLCGLFLMLIATRVKRRRTDAEDTFSACAIGDRLFWDDRADAAGQL